MYVAEHHDTELVLDSLRYIKPMRLTGVQEPRQALVKHWPHEELWRSTLVIQLVGRHFQAGHYVDYILVLDTAISMRLHSAVLC